MYYGNGNRKRGEPAISWNIYFCRENGSLERKVYHKSTHMDLYLNASSHPETGSTLVHWVRTCAAAAQSVPDELRHLREVFLDNRYNNQEDIHWACTKGNNTRLEDQDENKGLVLLPFFEYTSSKLGRSASTYNLHPSVLSFEEAQAIFVSS